MRIDYKNKIVFLANTKVASTSLEHALFAPGRQMGRIDGHPGIKHLNFSEFLRIRHVVRASNFKTICVVRHPIEKAKSWYKYRSRDELDGKPRSTKGITLETFLKNIPEKDFDDRLFCHDVESGNKVDLIFKYENIEVMVGFLQKIYGDSFQLKHKNKSPQLLLDDVSSDTIKRFQDAVDWYDSIPPVPDLSDINL